MPRLIALGVWWLCTALAVPATAAPLHEAVERGDLEAVASLLAEGAEVDAVDAFGDTPLHRAVAANAPVVAALLLENLANVDAKNRFGATPLHYAAARDARTIAVLLTANGADANATDQLGHTPLHWAARENASEVADALVEYGADAAAVSGWHWFYNRSADGGSWRRGKAWFDADMREFLALEKKRVEGAKSGAATKHIIAGVTDCAVSTVSGGSCLQAASNSAVNWLAELQHIKRWESALEELNANPSLHSARFLVPPNEQSRPVRIDGERPFTRYVARLTTSAGACTAFLVRPKIALTNSHCVCLDARCKQRIPRWEMKLTFARQDMTGRHDIVVGVRKVHYTDRSAGYHNDYAVLILDKAPKVGGHLEVAANADGVGAFATAGYPGDFFDGEVMTALWGCPLRAEGRLLTFSAGGCHNYYGASGSPYIAVDGPHRGKVVGINAYAGSGNNSGGGPSVAAFHERLQEIIRREER